MKNNLSGGQLAGGNSVTEREENDFYATDPKTTKIFLNEFGDYIFDCESFCEPACGELHITKVLQEYFNKPVFNIDLIDRGVDATIGDFLSYDFKDYKFDCVITNPPFSLAQEFIEKALSISNKYTIMLCKIQLLEGVKRKSLFSKTPLKYVYVHTTRQATWKNGEPLDPSGKKWATTMCLAWFVWEIGYEGEPIIRFL